MIQEVEWVKLYKDLNKILPNKTENIKDQFSSVAQSCLTLCDPMKYKIMDT